MIKLFKFLLYYCKLSLALPIERSVFTLHCVPIQASNDLTVFEYKHSP